MNRFVVVLLVLAGCKKPADEPANPALTGSRVSMNKVIKGEAGVGSLGTKLVGGLGIDLRATSEAALKQLRRALKD